MKQAFTPHSLTQKYLKYGFEMMRLIKLFNETRDPIVKIEIDNVFQKMETYRRKIEELTAGSFGANLIEPSMN